MSGNTYACWITSDRSAPIAFCPGAIAYSAAIAGKPAMSEMTMAAAANEHRRQTPTARLRVPDRSQLIALCSPRRSAFFQHLRIQRTDSKQPRPTSMRMANFGPKPDLGNDLKGL